MQHTSDKLNKSTLNVKQLGIGKGFIIQILRGIMYEMGEIMG